MKMTRPKKTLSVGFELTTKRPDIVDAPCQSVDPDTFFPDSTDLVKTDKAKSLCKQCNPETIKECLSFAMSNKIAYGIWGGLTAEERKNIRRRETRYESKNSI